MSEEPRIHPGDDPHQGPIARRSDEDVQRELEVDHRTDAQDAPGGAEGGEQSNSVNRAIDHPADTDPLGDTDQHSDPENLPDHRERENRSRHDGQRRS